MTEKGEFVCLLLQETPRLRFLRVCVRVRARARGPFTCGVGVRACAHQGGGCTGWGWGYFGAGECVRLRACARARVCQL